MKSVYWMRSAKFDLSYFHLSGLASLLLIIPYLIYREQAIWPIYSLYLIAFGLPHNFLTWSTLIPQDPKKHFNTQPLWNAFWFCVVVGILIALFRHGSFGDWILSFVAFFSLWHAYRQHHGICKVYDLLIMRRTGDKTLLADRKWMNIFFGLAANGVLVWAFQTPKIYYLLSPDDRHELIHPIIPPELFQLYVAATIFIGIVGLKQAFFDRWRRGLVLPWPQLALMTIAIATYIVPYFFMGLEAIPIPVAIGTIYHNIQYFGFVWLFEKERAKDLHFRKEPLALPQRLVLNGNVGRYAMMALGYSFAVIVVYKAIPKDFGLAFIYFIGLAHYIIDGMLWRRDVNVMMPKVLERWARPQSIPA